MKRTFNHAPAQSEPTRCSLWLGFILRLRFTRFLQIVSTLNLRVTTAVFSDAVWNFRFDLILRLTLVRTYPHAASRQQEKLINTDQWITMRYTCGNTSIIYSLRRYSNNLGYGLARWQHVTFTSTMIRILYIATRFSAEINIIKQWNVPIQKSTAMNEINMISKGFISLQFFIQQWHVRLMLPQSNDFKSLYKNHMTNTK